MSAGAYADTEKVQRATPLGDRRVNSGHRLIVLLIAECLP